MRTAAILAKSEFRRTAWIVSIFAVAGAVIGLILMPSSPLNVDPAAPAPSFSLLGQPIASTSNAAQQALSLVRKYAAGSLVIRLPDGSRREISRAALGAEIERVRLAQLINDTRDPASALRRNLGHRPHAGVIALPVPLIVNVDRCLSALLQLKDVSDRPAADARLELETRTLVAEKAGVLIDAYGTVSRVVDALRQGDAEIDAVVEKLEPALRADKLGNVKFDEILGHFETNYARGQKHVLRTFNLRLAASKLDGHVVMPGETFDFNDVVGPRDEAHGYKDAPVISEGELVDGIGGGTCQIAGTLHGAAFFAGLQIVARRPHTRPSAYIKMGLDAAVAYPSATLKLRNPFEFPVVLHETVKDGVVQAQVLGPRRALTVTFVRKILDISPYEQLERPDPKLPKGKRILGQRGIAGFKIQRHRIVRDGPFAVRERSIDTYPPTAQIVRVGTGEEAGKAAAAQDDVHPEYVADEYLVMTQGPAIRSASAASDDPNSGMIERRVPGKTGAKGWTQNAGFPWYKSENDKSDGCDGPADSCGKPSDSTPGAPKSKDKDKPKKKKRSRDN